MKKDSNEIEEIAEEIKKFYGDSLPSPTHHPLKYQAMVSWYIHLYRPRLKTDIVKASK